MMMCHACGEVVPDNAYFCPNCGKSVRPKPFSVSAARQAWVYVVSIAAPPFGLIYAWQYFKQGGGAARKIAIVIVILTVIALFITYQLAQDTIRSFNESLNALGGFGF